MRVIKSLLLGAAAGLAATAGVQAADMPVKAKAVEYVKICSAYGAGFYYIPGTDICLRVGGRVRADYYHNAPGVFPDVNSGNDRTEETHGLRGRGYVTMDARNNTPYGTLRAYINGYSSWTTSGGTATSSTGYGAGATSFGWDRAFIQFAGFTFGQATSFYDFWSNAAVGNIATWADPGTGASGWNVLAYTAQFGNGLSGTISIEDQRRRSIQNNVAPTFGAGANVRAGQNLPAVTAALRVDQAWGSAQVMAVWQELRTTEPAFSINSSGYAFGGGFTWNNPSSPGSVFGIQANYAKGAMGYVVSGPLGAHNILDGGGAGATGAVGNITDGVVVGTTLHKTSGWNVAAGYQHKINAQWAWSLYGGYADISYDSAVNTAFCVGATGTDCGFSFWGVGSRLNWTPVAGLEMGLDIMYHDFGTATVPGTSTIPAANLRDNDVWSAMFRVQRTW